MTGICHVNVHYHHCPAHADRSRAYYCCQCADGQPYATTRPCDRCSAAAVDAPEPEPDADDHSHVCPDCERAWNCTGCSADGSTDCPGCERRVGYWLNAGDRFPVYSTPAPATLFETPSPPTRPAPLAVQLSATSGAPARRRRAATAPSQPALLAEPAELVWHDFTTDERTPYAQASLF